ncbi:hypothetical protein O181_070933 [Austropuccinia psidii MF-1]|uniref:Reverse transcriptase domain-containing protein n=1 Tax=Austropuccinia psidii MF-1 TaxID=1389203 RepID=A0A9Q3I7R0_9BASI|nr:hypothetical protein [Austropuccinia psidii MF-1]
MRCDIIDVLYTYKNDFASDNEPLGAIKGNEVDITLNIDRPYPPVLRRLAYPASTRAREALEKHIQELIQLGVLRKLGNNKEVEETTPVIISWHNEKSRMVGYFGELNTYTVSDRYPIPRIKKTLTQLSEAKMPFAIKNAPSHYQGMMNTIFHTELSEGWLIIYIDYIIIWADSWYLHLERLAIVLDKFTGMHIKISLKKFIFAFDEFKSSGHIVSGLSFGIDKNKVEAVLLNPIPQKKK